MIPRALTVCGWLALGATAWGQRSEVLSPPDVLQSVVEIRSELALLSDALGADRPPLTALPIRNAFPRHSFSQARTLFENSERLLFERSRRLVATPRFPAGEPSSADVHRWVQASLAALQRVRADLDLDQPTHPVPRNDSATSTDVLTEIMRCNRLLEHLLSRRTRPAQTFLKLNEALSHAVALYLSPARRRIPTDPETDPAATTADAYDCLLECFELSRKIASRLDTPTAELGGTAHPAVSSFDLHELASLLAADVAFLYRKSGVNREAFEAVPHDPVLPAQVAQRAELLREYLAGIHDAEPPRGRQPSR